MKPAMFTYRNSMPEKDIRSILNVSFRILENTGLEIPHQRVLDMISSTGVDINPNNFVVKFPRKVVEASLEKIRKKQAKAAETKAVADTPIRISAGYIGGNLPSIWDMNARKVRSATKNDLLDAIKIANILGVWSFTPFLPSDVPPHTEDVNAVAISFKNCKYRAKTFYRIMNTESVKPLFDIMTIVSGSADKVRRDNMLWYPCHVISPLKFSRYDLERALAVYDLGCKVIFGMPMIVAGATGPVTMAGSLALGYAELMAGFVITHAFGFDPEGITTAPIGMDMGTGMPCYVDPKVSACGLTHEDFAKYIYSADRKISFGLRDARYPGIQAAVEQLTGIFLTILNNPEKRKFGVSLGTLATGAFGALPQVFIDLEIVDMLNGFFESMSIKVDQQTLAEELIKQVGIGGNFLAENHTAKHFREETWRPKLFRKEHLYQAATSDPVLEEAIKQTRENLKKDFPPPDVPLTEEQITGIDKIVERVNRIALA